MPYRLTPAIMVFAITTAFIGCNRASAPSMSSSAKGDGVMSELDQAIQRNPTDAEAYSKRANAWLRHRKFDEALNDYDQAIRLQPNYSEYWNNRGFTWHMKSIVDRDRPTCEDRALSDYAEAIRIDPRDASAINNRAWLQATSKVERCRDGKKSVEEATKACQLTDWKNGFYIDTLSVAYAESGDFEQAIRWLKKALEDASYQTEDGKNARKKLELFGKRQPFRE